MLILLASCGLLSSGCWVTRRGRRYALRSIEESISLIILGPIDGQNVCDNSFLLGVTHPASNSDWKVGTFVNDGQANPTRTLTVSAMDRFAFWESKRRFLPAFEEKMKLFTVSLLPSPPPLHNRAAIPGGAYDKTVQKGCKKLFGDKCFARPFQKAHHKQYTKIWNRKCVSLYC